MLYLHPDSLSPDPTYGQEHVSGSSNSVSIAVYPHELIRATPRTAQIMRWKRILNLRQKPPPLELAADADHRVDLLVDFGTEIDARLVLELKLGSNVNVMACFGESEPEAAGLVPGHNPNPTYYWHLQPGRRNIASETRGFRFVRLVFSDVFRPLKLNGIAAQAILTFRERPGDFSCSDRRFQRVWQSSLYTARLCTQPETVWDGIKRDRVGWFGDARISKLAVDNVFFDPRPAEAMLATLPTDAWANSIPNYSFDAVAMLRQHILFYGTGRACIRPCYQKVLAMLDWVRRTQCNRDGFIIRTNRDYFGVIGFLDWSPFPLGGRFEELSWLQSKYLEALRNASDIAAALGDNAERNRLDPQIARLEKLILKRFWNPRRGFVHTLNHIGNPPLPKDLKYGWSWNPFKVPMFDLHYRMTYEQNVKLGPSAPSRQCNALAVFAGLVSGNMGRTIRRAVFDNPAIPPVMTAYFNYYEQRARALCGDAPGAILHLREYIGNMLENEKAATIWEFYNPALTDIRKYFGSNGRENGFLWTWPISLCHGWGAGTVPITTEFLLGINPVSPGFGMVRLEPGTGIPWSFNASIPTPRGIIHAARESKQGKVQFKIPRGIKLTPETQARLGQEFTVSR